MQTDRTVIATDADSDSGSEGLQRPRHHTHDGGRRSTVQVARAARSLARRVTPEGDLARPTTRTTPTPRTARPLETTMTGANATHSSALLATP